MYTRNIFSILNSTCILKFSFKLTLTSFKFFFIVFNTYIVNMIKLVLIKIRLNIFRCFLHSTYSFIFMKQDFIHFTIKNIIIILLPVKFISWYRIMPVSLSRYDFNVIRTKFSQYLALI